MFFSFDGVDGVGKSTQVDLFCGWLQQMGHAVVSCRDPGSTQLSESIRSVLLERTDTPIARLSEMLLYMAARAQLVDEVIRPALAEGKTVVCDRFLLANVVYQGHAGGLEVDRVWQVGEIATSGILPELTFVLDMDIAAAAQRIQRTWDRMESQGLEFRQRLRQGFLAEAARQPEKICVIDASGEMGEIQGRIRREAQVRFGI
ncbi:MAG: dTMP kinase [Pirellulaceae bacterium]